MSAFGTEKNFGITDSLLDAVRGVVQNKEQEEDQVIDQTEEELEEKVDPVNPKAVKKDFDDRKDKDIDNDGDVDSSDEYLHKRRKAISKSMSKEKKTEVDTDPKLEGFDLDEAKKMMEAMRVLATKGKYKVVTKGDGVAHVMFGAKKVGSGDLDDGAGGWFMNVPGKKGQQFFDSPNKIADYFEKNKITG